jgi:preprotein translocase subunit SecA
MSFGSPISIGEEAFYEPFDLHLKVNLDNVELMNQNEIAELNMRRSMNASSAVRKAQRERNINAPTQRRENEESKLAGSSTIITKGKDYGRNEKVTVQYKDGKVLKDVKFKKVEQDILDGKCIVIN